MKEVEIVEDMCDFVDLGIRSDLTVDIDLIYILCEVILQVSLTNI